MSEYIDRNLITWHVCDYYEDASCEKRKCAECSRAECSHSQIMGIPIADVASVIHCKDCKYWDSEEQYCKHLSSEHGWLEDEDYRVQTEEDFYCADGAKMDKE